jgi:hypothetical protein
VLLVPAGLVHPRLLALGAAEEVALRQRGSLVGQFGLLRDEHDPAVEALGAQRLGGFRAGQSATDDHERFPSRHLGQPPEPVRAKNS